MGCQITGVEGTNFAVYDIEVLVGEVLEHFIYILFSLQLLQGF